MNRAPTEKELRKRLKLMKEAKRATRMPKKSLGSRVWRWFTTCFEEPDTIEINPPLLDVGEITFDGMTPDARARMIHALYGTSIPRELLPRTKKPNARPVGPKVPTDDSTTETAESETTVSSESISSPSLSPAADSKDQTATESAHDEIDAQASVDCPSDADSIPDQATPKLARQGCMLPCTVPEMQRSSKHSKGKWVAPSARPIANLPWALTLRTYPSPDVSPTATPRTKAAPGSMANLPGSPQCAEGLIKARATPLA